MLCVYIADMSLMSSKYNAGEIVECWSNQGWKLATVVVVGVIRAHGYKAIGFV